MTGVVSTSRAPGRRRDGSCLAASPRSLPCALLLFALPWFASAADKPPSSLPDAFQSAQQAAQAQDYTQMRAMLQHARRVAPGHPAVVFHLARSQALAGDAQAALATLEWLAVQGANRDLKAEPAFATLHKDPRFAALAQRIAQAAAPKHSSRVAQQLDDVDFLPEGLAHDADSGRFFAGSIHGRGIVQWSEGEAARPFVRVERGDEFSVLGLRVDATRGVLWAATLRVDAGAPAFFRGRGGWAALEAFSLADGKRVARHPAPRDGAPHLFNDIALDPDGDVYVTDSEGRAIWRLRAGALEKVIDDNGRFTYPNGIARMPDGWIYVAHMEGISRFHVSDERPTLRQLALPTGVADTGVDGLYVCGDGLLAIQGLLGFEQVTRLALQGDEPGIVAAQALERRHPAHDAPTTGAIVGDRFYYLANAQVGRLDPDWNLIASESATHASVLALTLRGACSGTTPVR